MASSTAKGSGGAGQGPKPVYALVGSDSFLQLEQLGEILRLFPAEVQRIDVDGERAELAEILDELRSFAMFGGGKVVVVRNGEQFISNFRESLEKYLSAPSDSGTLVLRTATLPKNHRIYKLIEKAGQVMTCEAPKNLAQWIIARARGSHRAVIGADAAELLAELIGGDMGRLDNELAKLALLCADEAGKSKIDAASVEANVAFQRDQEMWHMTDELSRGRAGDAVRRWRQLMQVDSATEFRAVTWLGMWLEKAERAIGLSRGGANAYTIGQELRIWPRDAAEAFVRTALRLGAAGVRRGVDMLVEVDYQSKTGVGNMGDNVERFLLSFGTMLAARSTPGQRV